MQYDSWTMFEARAAESVMWTWPLQFGPSFYPTWWPEVLKPPAGGWIQALKDAWDDFWNGLRLQANEDLDGESFSSIEDLTDAILAIADARAQDLDFEDMADWLSQFEEAPPGEGAGG
jgi:hypothetical protein